MELIPWLNWSYNAMAIWLAQLLPILITFYHVCVSSCLILIPVASILWSTKRLLIYIRNIMAKSLCMQLVCVLSYMITCFDLVQHVSICFHWHFSIFTAICSLFLRIRYILVGSVSINVPTYFWFYLSFSKLPCSTITRKSSQTG
jgi:hypothetical protein